MPFSDQCGFVVEDDLGFYDRCEEDADFGIYFRKLGEGVVSMISLCHYHTIVQESYWKGGASE